MPETKLNQGDDSAMTDWIYAYKLRIAYMIGETHL